MRKKEKVNKICGERLRELIKAQKLTQCEFANLTNYTEQQISYMVNGKRRITPDAAIHIAEMFPPIRFEWLLGLDDFRTPLESKLDKPIKKAFEITCTRDYFFRFTPVFGYKFIEHEFPEAKEMEAILNDTSEQIDPVEYAKVFEEYAIFEKKHEHEKYDVMFGGKIIAQCGDAELSALSEEVGNFLKFKLFEFTDKLKNQDSFTSIIN